MEDEDCFLNNATIMQYNYMPCYFTKKSAIFLMLTVIFKLD